MGFQDFTKDRGSLLSKIPAFEPPDFADPCNLPLTARKPEDQHLDEIPDQSANTNTLPFSHMNSAEWEECYKVVSQVFTGHYRQPGERQEVDRHLEVGKGDLMSSQSRWDRRQAQGSVTIDIDSTLALFTDLSVINTVLKFTVVANPAKNLTNSVHLRYKDMPLHWIPHFHIGEFGHDPNWDLFVFLPKLYRSGVKRTKNNLYNHIPEEKKALFMDEVFLPAVRKHLTPNESQHWPSSYAAEHAKSRAPGIEGRSTQKRDRGLYQLITHPLDPRHIPLVWKSCRQTLIRRREQEFDAFVGLQFFISSKGHKNRTANSLSPDPDNMETHGDDLETHAGGFAKLMNTFKEKVTAHLG